VASVQKAARGAVPPDEAQERILPALAETKALPKLFESRNRVVMLTERAIAFLFDAAGRFQGALFPAKVRAIYR
jgi:hypothetical protein